MGPILITAGESSGEKYGADLVRQFKKNHPSASFFGIGGNRMAAEGVQLLFGLQDLAVVGAIELVSHLPRLWKIYSRVKKEVKSRKPRAAVLIDSPDFNLRLARFLRKLEIPVLYYISPTVWAWRENRLKIIKKNVSRMMLIFPFEEEIYRKWGIPASYIGHPLKETIHSSLPREEFFKRYGLDPKKMLISILPGSRRSEVKYHMPVLVQAIPKIFREFEAQGVLLRAENIDENFLSSFIPEGLKDLRLLDGHTYEAMASSDLVLSACGTANLEAALLNVPLITFYRLSPLSYRLGVRLIRIKNYSIVNILAGEKIIPELIQKDFTAENILSEIKNILGSKNLRSEMAGQFQRLSSLLGDQIASPKAARELEKILLSRRP